MISGIVTDRHATVKLTFLLLMLEKHELVVQFTEGGLVTIEELL